MPKKKEGGGCLTSTSCGKKEAIILPGKNRKCVFRIAPEFFFLADYNKKRLFGMAENPSLSSGGSPNGHKKKRSVKNVIYLGNACVTRDFGIKHIENEYQSLRLKRIWDAPCT